MAKKLHIPEASCFECIRCGRCCSSLEVTLSPAEYERLSGRDWAAADPRLDGASLFARTRRNPARPWRLRARRDGRCVFLGDDNLCIIHAEMGPRAKPLPCRLPFRPRCSR